MAAGLCGCPPLPPSTAEITTAVLPFPPSPPLHRFKKVQVTVLRESTRLSFAYFRVAVSIISRHINRKHGF
uniref:Uncharacterized protein n=1 Tax=Anguilla anguilla TaxID=7936 RepID=A0A0E9QUD9_ANGAN